MVAAPGFARVSFDGFAAQQLNCGLGSVIPVFADNVSSTDVVACAVSAHLVECNRIVLCPLRTADTTIFRTSKHRDHRSGHNLSNCR
jgi:hypothetical protein